MHGHAMDMMLMKEKRWFPGFLERNFIQGEEICITKGPATQVKGGPLFLRPLVHLTFLSYYISNYARITKNEISPLLSSMVMSSFLS